MGNKDRDLYEKTGRFGSKNKMSAFIPPFILTLSAKYKRNADHFILVPVSYTHLTLPTNSLV